MVTEVVGMFSIDSIGWFLQLSSVCCVPSLQAATTASVAFEKNAVNCFQGLELRESFDFTRIEGMHYSAFP